MSTAMVEVPGKLGLKVGELVQVRSADEIRSTLDARGELDGLPFMPEMLPFCGQRLTVDKVAHKLCDFVGKTGMKRMHDAVILTGSRCDGSAHGGCDNRCTIVWKEQWLRRVDPGTAPPASPDPGARALLPLLVENTQREPFEDGATRYSCQGTEMPKAAPEPLPLRDLGQFRADVASGNVGVRAMLASFFVGLFNRYQAFSRQHLPRALRWHDSRGWQAVCGRVTSGRTPTEILDLQPGEWVRVKSREEIEATLDSRAKNRGMGFDVEMSRFFGRTARVKARASRCVDESTGRMLVMQNPCIILEDIVCTGAYNASCPRQYVCWWREIWLERVEAPTA